MESQGYPKQAIEGLKSVVDCNLVFFDHTVSVSQMYAVLSITVVLLVAIFILLNFRKGKK